MMTPALWTVLLLTLEACPWARAAGAPSSVQGVLLLDPEDLGYLPPVKNINDTKCGINIPNGARGKEEVHLGEYPWMALLGYTSSVRPGRTVYSCGGSLINDRYVLTAAHCVSRLPKKLRVTTVRLGEHNITSERDCMLVDGRERCAEPAQDYEVEEIIPHPEHHKPKQYRNDIALIRLSRPVRRNDYVRPICLPFDPSLRRVLIGKTLTVAGFGAVSGQSDEVRELTVPVIDNKLCQSVFRRYRTAIGDSQICAGGQKGRGACSGDAGGPLMAVATRDQPYFLVGVVSFGPARCGTKDVPDVYTRVTEYEQWILDNMRP